MANGPFTTTVNSTISSLDGLNMSRTSTATVHDPGSLVSQLHLKGLHDEAEIIASLWLRLRAAMDSASQKCSAKGL